MLFVVGLAVIAVYPWVIDAVARAVLADRGVRIDSSSAGYGGVVWRGLHFDRGGNHLQVEELKFGGLSAFLFGREPLSAKGVQFSNQSSSSEAGESESSLPPAVFALIGSIFRNLERWVPGTEVSSIRIEWRAGGLSADALRWRDGQATIEHLTWLGQPLIIKGEAWRPVATTFLVESWSSNRLLGQFDFEGGASVRVIIDPSTKAPMVRVVASARWPSGKCDANAEWGSSSWIPVTGSLSGEATAFPAALPLDVSKWSPDLRWQADFQGATGPFSISLEGSGWLPSSSAETPPVPWNMAVEANGDEEEIWVTKGHLDIPLLHTDLNHPLRIDRVTLRPVEAVRMRWSLDLGAAHLAGWEGQAEGLFELEPNSVLDGARFEMSGEGRDIRIPGIFEMIDLRSLTFSAEGSMDAQAVNVVKLAFRGEDLGAVEGTVHWNRVENLVGPIALTGRIEPEGLLLWLDPGMVEIPEGITFSVKAEEDTEGWGHSGQIDVTQLEVGKNWSAAAKVLWRGRDADLHAWTLDLIRPEVRLSAGGSLSAHHHGIRLQISHLNEERETGDPWTLLQPVTFEWLAPVDDEGAVLVLSSLQITRPGGGSLEVEGRWEGWDALSLTAKIRELTVVDAAPWVGLIEIPELSVPSLDLNLTTVSRSHGSFIWQGSGRLDATWISPRQRRWIGSGGWQLEADRLTFEDVLLRADTITWLDLRGTIPCGLIGDQDSVLRAYVDRDGVIDLQAELEPVDRLPQPLEERLPFNIREFSGHLHATGTIRHPTARIEARADQLTWLETDLVEAIELRDLSLQAAIQEGRFELEGLSLRLANAADRQTISGSIGDIDWVSWWEDPRSERWLELSGDLELERWPVSSLGRFLPVLIEPHGSLTFALQKAVGLWPTGRLSFEGLSSEPLGGGLVARQISGAANLKGQRLDDLEVTGTIGGQPWSLQGWIDAEDGAGLLFHLALEADRLDLVRRTDLILRGKVSLEALREDLDTPPVLRGEINMLRSLFLQDLQDFTRKGATGAPRRPPYFSVDSELFSDWELDVQLLGDRFLQIRSTVLVGEASADVHLGGTLGTPLLVGEAWVDRGTLLFPFARLPSNELRGRITEEDPHTVQLSGGGGGVSYGYAIQYQLSGTSEAPTLTFSSVPSLAQDDILLMIATGIVPSSEMRSSGPERAGRLALYLGQDIFSELFGQDSGDRLEIRGGDGFSPFRRSGQVIEYKLDDNWSVLGEYDDFGGYNVDLKRKLIQ